MLQRSKGFVHRGPRVTHAEGMAAFARYKAGEKLTNREAEAMLSREKGRTSRKRSEARERAHAAR